MDEGVEQEVWGAMEAAEVVARVVGAYDDGEATGMVAVGRQVRGEGQAGRGALEEGGRGEGGEAEEGKGLLGQGG